MAYLLVYTDQIKYCPSLSRQNKQNVLDTKANINISSRVSFPQSPDFSTFQPIPSLDRSDADSNLVFIRNNVFYTDKIDDTLFKATTEYNKTLTKLYSPDAPLSALGCTEQYKFCNESDCTSLNGIMAFKDQVETYLNYSREQLTMFNILWRTFELTRLEIPIHYLTNRMLLANEEVLAVTPISAPLASNQWHLEVQSLFNTTMAMIQLIPLMRTIPPKLPVSPNATYDMLVRPPGDVLSENVCSYQKIRTQAFNSISVLGLGLICGIGGLIICTSLVVPLIMERLLAKDSERMIDWNDNGIVELARGKRRLDSEPLELPASSTRSASPNQNISGNREDSPLLSVPPDSSETEIPREQVDETNDEITPV